MAAQETRSNNVSTVVIGSRLVMITPLATQTQAPLRPPVVTQTQSVTQTVLCACVISNRTTDLKTGAMRKAVDGHDWKYPRDVQLETIPTWKVTK